jgi:glycosyltransferase involved in cell wall biosynthesis
LTTGNEAPPRLAFLIGTVSGGTAKHVVALAAGCAAEGFPVSVYGPAEARPLFGTSTAFVPVMISDRPRPARDAQAIVALRRQFAATRPDVVHAHGVRAGAFGAFALLLLPRRARPALAVTVHNGPPQSRAARLVYGVLERVCVRRCDTVLCASSDLAARMRRLGAADVQQFDVPAGPANPPSAAAVAKARADIGADGRPVVLAVGRLAPQKGFDILIAAAASWGDRTPAPRTVIAGGGPLAADLAAQARRDGADVLLLGERDDVPALLANADVFVLPSRWEARALILQEALRAGRAVVATRSGGTPSLTGEEAAILVPPEDPAELAAAVSCVLDDPALATRLQRAAAARAAASFPTQEDAVRTACTLYRRLAHNGALT